MEYGTVEFFKKMTEKQLAKEFIKIKDKLVKKFTAHQRDHSFIRIKQRMENNKLSSASSYIAMSGILSSKIERRLNSIRRLENCLINIINTHDSIYKK